MSENKHYIWGFAITVASAILLGFYPSIARVLYIDGIDFVAMILVVTAVRFLVMLVSGIIAFRKKHGSESLEIKSVMSVGISTFVSSCSIFVGLQYLEAPVMMIVFFSYPIFLTLFNQYIKKEHVPSFIWLTLVLVFIGLCFVVLGGVSLGKVNYIGLLWAGIAVVASVFRGYLLGVRVHVNKDDPSIFGAQFTFISLLCCLVLYAVKGATFPSDFENWSLLILAGLVLGIGGTLGIVWGTRFLGAVRFNLLLNVEPVAGTVIAALFINEVLSPTQYMGVAIVVSCIVFYQWAELKQRSGNKT